MCGCDAVCVDVTGCVWMLEGGCVCGSCIYGLSGCCGIVGFCVGILRVDVDTVGLYVDISMFFFFCRCCSFLWIL